MFGSGFCRGIRKADDMGRPVGRHKACDEPAPSWCWRMIHAMARAIPSLRPRLHAEIDLPEKKRGIAIQPHW
jgi:hypothetical protein